MFLKKLTSRQLILEMSIRVPSLLIIFLLSFLTASINSLRVGAAPSGSNNTLFLALYVQLSILSGRSSSKKAY